MQTSQNWQSGILNYQEIKPNVIQSAEDKDIRVKTMKAKITGLKGELYLKYFSITEKENKTVETKREQKHKV